MTLLYIVLALFALGVLVFIHELGHYFVARWCKMNVETFSIGFGKPLMKWKASGVNWQIGWLPFGGYVKIKGMEFSKKSKNEYVDPYKIEGGFFAQSPWKRMAVIFAGPFANFILAVLIFFVIWASGGRQKNFSEFTQYIGWVDPSSEIYAKGVRAGDLLQSFDSKPFKGSKDLLYAGILSGKDLTVRGAHVDWKKGSQKEFSYKIEPFLGSQAGQGIKTSGIETMASYLIYDPLHAQDLYFDASPMVDSGIKPMDRLVWVDGELLFSLRQLSALLNRNYALLTIERGQKTFLSRQPRLYARDLMLSSNQKGELLDWKYAAKLDTDAQKLFLLPYVIGSGGEIIENLSLVDPESERTLFALYPHSSLDEPLREKDRIVAIDGVPFSNLPAMLKQLQSHQVHLIVQANATETLASWKNEDNLFASSFDMNSIQQLAKSIGKEQATPTLGDVRLLNPVVPKAIEQFHLGAAARKLVDSQIEARKEQIEAMKDPVKRKELLVALEKEQKKRLLGIPLQDQRVGYNPGPMELFKAVFVETWQTLGALIGGNLHPKWLSGPVGIVRVIQHSWTIGINEALFWIAAISVNLGVVNLLPLPVLDGGYICLSLWEIITRRRLHPKTMERLILPFLVLLIALFLFLTFQDVIRLF